MRRTAIRMCLFMFRDRSCTFVPAPSGRRGEIGGVAGAGGCASEHPEGARLAQEPDLAVGLALSAPPHDEVPRRRTEPPLGDQARFAGPGCPPPAVARFVVR